MQIKRRIFERTDLRFVTYRPALLDKIPELLTSHAGLGLLSAVAKLISAQNGSFFAHPVSLCFRLI